MRALRRKAAASRTETADQGEQRLKTRLRQALNELDDQEREFQDKERTLKKIVTLLVFLAKDAAESDCIPILDRLKSELKKGVDRPALELILTDLTDRITRQANENPTRQPPALQAVGKTPAEQPPQKKATSPTPASPTLVQPETRADSSSSPSQPQLSRSQQGSAKADSQPPRSRHRSEGDTKQPDLQQAPDSARPSQQADSSRPPSGSRHRNTTKENQHTEKPTTDSAARHKDNEAEPQLRTLFTSALEHLSQENQPTLTERIDQVTTTIQSSALLSRIGDLHYQFDDLLKQYALLHADERIKAAEVLRDIATKLAEVESNFAPSLLANQKEITADNAKFIHTVEGHLASLTEATQLTDLTAVHHLITEKAENMRAVVQTKREFDAEQAAAFEAKIQNLEQQMQEANGRLSNMQQQVYRDPLIEDIGNRLAFNEQLGLMLATSQEKEEPCCLILFDMDHFKNINDTYGHQAGDQTLKTIATCARYALRPADFLARYGGDEFCILLPRTELETAAQVAQQLCDLVRRTSLSYETAVLQVTLSIGVAALSPEDSPETFFERADQALYYAKEQGRDQACTEAVLSTDEDSPSKLKKALGFFAKALPFKKNAA